MSIRLEQVTKDFHGTAAVSDVSVDIADGEFFVLLGPSGSGKSTLLRAIAGLTPVDHGRIWLRGRDVTMISAREREVGFVFQNYALFRHMSVADNIEFSLRARRVRAAARRKRRRELLELVALEGMDDRLPSELSGGQQQRVAVARALAHEPRVLLLDEPFGALDARIRDELRHAIRSIQQAVGITTVLVTHDQEEALTMADRIGVMDRSRLQEVAEPQELYAHPGTRFVATFLGTANLLLGRLSHGGVHLGDAFIPADRRGPAMGPALLEGDEVTVVVRPENLELRKATSQRDGSVIGQAIVDEIQFVGSVERLRLTVAASEALVWAADPDAEHFGLEAIRTTRETATLPVSTGQKVAVAVRRVHMLPTPISRLQLTGDSDPDRRLADSPLVRELAARMGISVIGARRLATSPPQVLTGLPIVGLDGTDEARAAIRMLSRGVRQVLEVRPEHAPIKRVLVHVAAPEARDAALAAAASVVRHLSADVVMLVPAVSRANGATGYPGILGLRDAALSRHGLDARTRTFRGNATDAIHAILADARPTLLVLGVRGSGADTAALSELARVAECPAAAAVLWVSPRAEPRLHAAAGLLG